ncbi:DUF4097 family beta strand repeat-containing protein [Streptomyces sp. ID05-26A]|nr:DUF4097 family beta strand repeat-containing protein [Streptomyces sp. ID05-26A]
MMRTALVALVAGAVLTVSTGCGIRIMKYEFQDDHVVGETFTSVKVRSDNDSGNVTIRYQQGLAETKIHRKVEHTKDNRPSGVAHRIEGDTLVLDGCGRNCEIDYEVVVPSAKISVVGDIGSGDAVFEGMAAVEFKTGSGRVVTRDIAGDVKVRTGSGEFEATRVGGAVTADVGSGRIVLDAIKGKALLVAGSGDIDGTSMENEVIANADSGRITLMFSAAKQVRAITGSGDITIRMPGGPFKIVGSADSGERGIHVPTDPNASIELNLNAGSGDIRVLAA